MSNAATSGHSFELSDAKKAWLEKHVTLHRVLWLLTSASFLIAWNRGLALLYGVFALLLALLLLSWLLPWWQLRGIRVQRLPFRRAVAGESGAVHYRLDAPGRRFQLRIEDRLPGVSDQACTVYVPQVHLRADVTLAVTWQQRGCFDVGAADIVSAYPFGVISFRRAQLMPTQQLLVWPRQHDISALPLPSLAQSPQVGTTPFSRPGGHDDFAHVREYRHGDPLKRIHWAASARQAALMVREYDRVEFPVVLLVLDCRPDFVEGEGANSTFERAVEMVSAIMRYVSCMGWEAAFFAHHAGADIQGTLAPFATDHSALNDQLAKLVSDGAVDYPGVVSVAQKIFTRANVVVTFSLVGAGEALVLSPGTSELSIQFDAQSFRTGKAGGRCAPVATANGYRYRVSAGDHWPELFR